MSDNEKSGSGIVGVGLGAAATGAVAYKGTQVLGNSAITKALDGADEVFKEGGKKVDFATAVKKAGAAPLKEGATETAGAALKSAQAIIKPAEGVEKATGEVLKAAKATRSEALGTIRAGLKADKASLMKGINGKHLAGVAVGALAVGYATKKVSDGLFGSKASRIEAERAQADQAVAR